MSYIQLNKDINVSHFEKTIGTISEFYFKEGNYAHYFSGSQVKLNLWFWKEGKNYFRYKSDTLFCDKPELERRFEILSKEVSDSSFNILNYECKRLTTVEIDKLTQKKKKTIFYYSDKISIDPIGFEKMKDAGDDIRYKITKSIPLKIILEDEGVKIMVFEAIEVSEGKVSDSHFDIGGYKIKGCE